MVQFIDEREYYMKKHFIVLTVFVFLLLCLTGCEDSFEKETTAPVEVVLQNVEYNGAKFYDVYNALENNGFTNINIVPLDDLSSVEKEIDDIVDYITIDGCSAFSIGDTYMSDVEIHIYYHNIDMLFAPFSSDELDGNSLFEEVKTQFEDAGFTNVIGEPIEDLIFGWLTKDGEVEEILIEGNSVFEDIEMFPFDAEIVIKYHTFPSSETDFVETNAEEYETIETNGNIDTESEIEILTAENNAELAAILSFCSDDYTIVEEFAAKYKGRIIEFDGNIAYMSNHGSYTTRFDILIGTGDYDENSLCGPGFQFRDVNAFDMDIDTLWLEDYLHIGDNIHVIAKVVAFDPASQLFQLEPISVVVK